MTEWTSPSKRMNMSVSKPGVSRQFKEKPLSKLSGYFFPGQACPGYIN
jgi:hypothetical protein